MKNSPLKNLIIGVAVVVGGASAPIIPADLEYLYSYQYDTARSPIVLDSATSTPKEIATKGYIDTDGNGLISVSVFADRKGTIIHTQLDDRQYADMGKVAGYLRNPEKTELISLLETLTPKADAAIAFDAASEDKVALGATSLTYAHTTSGSDRALIIDVTTISDAVHSISSVTYNGVSATVVQGNVLVFASTNWWHHVYQLVAPATGSNNIVITKSNSNGSIRSGAVSYTGVNQTTPIHTSNTGSGTSGAASIALTTSTATWFLFSAANIDAAFAAGTITDTLRTSYSGLADAADSGNDISSGTNNANMTYAGSREWGGVALALAPSGGGAPPRRIIITRNDI